MAEWPTGTVTFLFTDLGSSTRLWEDHTDAMHDALARHDVLLREAPLSRARKRTDSGASQCTRSWATSPNASVIQTAPWSTSSWGWTSSTGSETPRVAAACFP